MDSQTSVLNTPECARIIRLQRAVKRIGGIDRAAAISGRTTRQIRRYLKGDNAPLTVIAKIAEAADYSLDWLQTGRGVADRSAPKQLRPLLCFSLSPCVPSNKRLPSILELDPADDKFWDKLTSRITQRAEARRG